MKYIAAITISFLMAACVSSTDITAAPDYQRITFEGTKATASERARCEAAGGVVQRAGRLGAEHCIQNLPDAGQACSDESDCLGRCIISAEAVENLNTGTPVTGVCEATDNVFGCTALVNSGQYEGTICID